jgi:hypothetical protein
MGIVSPYYFPPTPYYFPPIIYSYYSPLLFDQGSSC